MPGLQPAALSKRRYRIATRPVAPEQTAGISRLVKHAARFDVLESNDCET